MVIVNAMGNDAAKDKHQMIVNISWTLGTESGGITVDERSYNSPIELVPLLQARVNADPSMRVLIRADKQTQYSYLRAVLLAVGQTSANNATFSILDKDQGKGQVAAQ